MKGIVWGRAVAETVENRVIQKGLMFHHFTR